MKLLKTAALMLACLLCALALTACHTDADPWPASQPAGGAPAATESGADGQAPVDAPTTAPVDAHPLDTGTEPGLNG